MKKTKAITRDRRRLDPTRGLLHVDRMHCFGCGAEVGLLPGVAVGFRAGCEGCGADLHVCRNCAHHDSGYANECREPVAEPVSDRERANRCEYFRPAQTRAAGMVESQAAARARLEALFKKS